MKSINVAIPESTTEKRVNGVIKALESYSANIKYDGKYLTFDVDKDTTDEHICQIGMLIGVNLCKMF
jgi:hypothetical protein